MCVIRIDLMLGFDERLRMFCNFYRVTEGPRLVWWLSTKVCSDVPSFFGTLWNQRLERNTNADFTEARAGNTSMRSDAVHTRADPSTCVCAAASQNQV